MIPIPQNISEIESLIRNKIPESLHLDYKASPALSPEKSKDIAKDVSAFANSDGGLLIYGVEEDSSTHLPLRLDAGAEPKRNREWLDQIIATNITPRVDGIEIREFQNHGRRLFLCVKVPQSYRAPHQACDFRYYKRFNFSSFPMEHYEVEDIRSRRQILAPLISLDMETPHETALFFVLRNIGRSPASEIKFKWDPHLKWPGGSPPRQFSHGIAFLPPGKTLRIINHGTEKFFDAKDRLAAPKFDIEVSYTHGEGAARVTDVFRFDIADYYETLLYSSDTERLEKSARDISQEIRNLTQAIKDGAWRK